MQNTGLKTNLREFKTIMTVYKNLLISEPTARIETAMKQFNKQELLIADYLIADCKVNLSITELARNTKTSTATISRFCRKIGYENYKQFQKALTNQEEYPLPPFSNINDTACSANIEKVYATYFQSISNTIKLLLSSELEKAVEIIVNAKRIEFFGSGGSGVLAEMAYFSLRHLGLNTHFSHHEETAALLGNEDVAFAISHSGTHGIEALTKAKSRDAKTICIVAFSGTPLADSADITLLAGSEKKWDPSCTVDCRASTLFLLDVLFLEILKKVRSSNMG